MDNINKTPDQYRKLINKVKPPVNKLRNIVKAYIIGGLICVIGQSFWYLYMKFNVSQDDAGTMATITMIFLGGLFTGLGVYDELGQFAGAGTIVPITGFANAMVSPAMEYKQEGLISGLGTKLFNVAGPVITYGMVSAFIVGLLKVVLAV